MARNKSKRQKKTTSKIFVLAIFLCGVYVGRMYEEGISMVKKGYSMVPTEVREHIDPILEASVKYSQISLDKVKKGYVQVADVIVEQYEFLISAFILDALNIDPLKLFILWIKRPQLKYLTFVIFE